ncbi:MAG: dihydrofolate synthase [Acidimicrobiia bacterium]|nr:dihydrofolate synthase [Acidimicrobiia bacterium]
MDRHIGRGVKPGTERIVGLLGLMGDPHGGYPAIHIAGSNGKTTTARLVAGLLAAHGLKPGLFTSPHLQVVEERFEVAGERMRAEELGPALEDVLPFAELYEARTGDGITYFELTAALAFSWFAARAVDAAVVEVGLGGRLDATNVLDAEVAVITSISLEHTQYLGDTLAAIAGEKAAILRPGRTLVTGNLPAEALEVAGEQAAAGGSAWLRLGADFAVTQAQRAVGGWLVDLEGVYRAYSEVRLPLLGRHQTANLAVAVAAVEAFFGRALDPDGVIEAAAAARSPGRMEVVRRDPPVLLDGAHNPEGSAALAAALAEGFPTTRWAVVFGAMSDKDVPAMLESLAPAAASFHTARAAGSERARSAAEVAALAAEAAAVPVFSYGSVGAAVAAALASGMPVLVTGSLYVVGEARGALGALGLGPAA